MPAVERILWWLVTAVVLALTNWTLAALHAPVVHALTGAAAPLDPVRLILDALFLLPFIGLALWLTRRVAGAVGGAGRMAVAVAALSVAGAAALGLVDTLASRHLAMDLWSAEGGTAPLLVDFLVRIYGTGPGAPLVLIAPLLALALRLTGIHAAPARLASVTGLMFGAWVLLTPVAWGLAAVTVSLFGIDPFEPVVPSGGLPHHAPAIPAAPQPLHLLRCLVTDAVWLLPFLALAEWPGFRRARNRVLIELPHPMAPKIQWQRLPERG